MQKKIERREKNIFYIILILIISIFREVYIAVYVDIIKKI